MLRRKRTKTNADEAIKDTNETIGVSVTDISKKGPIFPHYYLFLIIFAIRLVNVTTIRTFFQADEFFQALEPAHKYVYGYGYITWEWHEKLRSSIHPFIYVLAYKLVDYFNGEIFLVLLVPKVISALIASLGELMLFQFVQKYTGDQQLASISLLLSLLNPFNWYVITRSFSNCFELTLILAAFRFWPWNYHIDVNYYIGLALAIVSCIVRPTNAILWLVLGCYLLARTTASKLKFLVSSVAVLITIVLVNLLIDYSFYKEWTFPLYNFLEFNVLKNLSIFYGVAPWHFYLFQAIPLLLMTYLPFFLHSLVYNYKNVLFVASSIVLLAFSLIGHKEFRFIYPLLPVFLLFTSYSVKLLYNSNKKLAKRIFVVVVIINFAIAYFFSRVNERGAIDVIDYLRDEKSVESFGFLTPCHSTPWQSHLHNVKYENSWFLTCEPPLHLGGDTVAIKNYMDESDIFFANPTQFLDEHFPSLHGKKILSTKYTWPSHIVIFEPLEATMREYFENTLYHECRRFFNSYFHWDGRRSGDIIVYCNI